MPERIPVYTVSLGCAKNLVDTETLLGGLGHLYTPVESLEQCRVVLINTCGFIQPAVEESVQTILETAQDLGELPREQRPLLAVTGCLLARYGQQLRQELPEVDLWIPVEEQRDAGRYLLRALGEGQTGLPEESDPPRRVISTGSSYAYLKISEGCDRACSFCLIPRIRGGMRSRSVASLKEEARYLLEQGVRELVLVGQDVTAYGKDLGRESDLPRLVAELSELPGLAWLRLMYLYPTGITDELLSRLRELSPPLLPYFDIPLQHAHPEILKRMGRPFAVDPDEVLEKIRSHFPEASLRTTLLTGFPGEQERHFRTLEDFVRRTRFQHLGVFSFWPEEGVKAASYPEQVPEKIKQERQQELMRIQAEISRQIHAQYEGEEVWVLLDRDNPEWPTLYEGRIWCQAPEVDGICYLSGQGIGPGDMVRATVEETRTYDLIALA